MKTWKDTGPGTVALELTVPGTPQPAGSKTAFPVRRKGGDYAVDTNGRPIINTVDDNDAKVKPWKDDVATLARYARGAAEPEAGPLALELTFYLERKPSVQRVFPTVRPDVLKLARAVEDALTGVVYKDDAQIILEHLEKRYAGNGEGAGVIVKVTRL